MVNTKVTEAWINLWNEAMQGTKESQQALKALSRIYSNQEDLSRWMSNFMPKAYASTGVQPEAFEEWLEDWWRAMGVVPRSRYLELLEKYDIVQRRLEKAEETVQKLQAMLGKEGQDEEAQKVLDLWSNMLEETLKTQTEWMQAWTAANEPKSPAPDVRDDSVADQPDAPASDHSEPKDQAKS